MFENYNGYEVVQELSPGKKEVKDLFACSSCLGGNSVCWCFIKALRQAKRIAGGYVMRGKTRLSVHVRD